MPHKKVHKRRFSQNDLYSIVGVFSDMSLEHKEAAVLFSLVHFVKAILLQYESSLKLRLKEVTIGGELAQSPFFLDVLADILQMSVICFKAQSLSVMGSLISTLMVGSDMSDKELKKLRAINFHILPQLDPLSSFSKHQTWEQCC